MIALVSGYDCPSSGAFVHASCKTTVLINADCATVETEVLARVNGQPSAWHDPHNNGTYSILKTSSGSIALKRLTGNGKYTDKLTLTLSAAALESNFQGSTSPGKCVLQGCSESQSTSVADFSIDFSPPLPPSPHTRNEAINSPGPASHISAASLLISRGTPLSLEAAA